MKPIIDHIGIAVSDLDAALAFYRDALGLELTESEEVLSQRVRAHFLPVGQVADGSHVNLELLQATAPDSPIAKFIDKHGAGIHHITLRVPDVAAAIATLTARGLRLIDEQPRPGAEGSTIAFVHPTATGGVLVELKQAAAAPAPVRESRVIRYPLGNLELISLCDGFLALDGGAMFGTVPKALWEKKTTPDERNRITLAMRPLIVRGARTMMIDAGLGDKGDERFREIYRVERERNLDHALADAGLSVEDIDIVLATHLHFDHAGGFTARDRSGRVRPRFPRAQYIVRRGEWEDATHPHERNRASYLPDDYVPLADAGVLQMVDDDQTIMPGVRVRRTPGHTAHHQIVLIESAGKSAAFVADLMPTTAHLPNVWIMGYDLYPMDTLASKKAFANEAIERETLVFFEHDPSIVAGYLRRQKEKEVVEPATPTSAGA
ncbi:MAG TPA: methylmalonyl-CoA epimerase [Vicinamibacterales bacterium]